VIDILVLINLMIAIREDLRVWGQFRADGECIQSRVNVKNELPHLNLGTSKHTAP
jgi:hypothetical protein